MDANLSPFVFYLTLEDHLPDTFYSFDRQMRDQGAILVPVKIDQLQTLVASSEQEHVTVICSVINSHEYKIYNEKIRGLLKFVLKSKRISFMHLSSFSKLNDTKHFMLARNYYFMKYPLNARTLTDRIIHYQEEKMQKTTKWPGGTRAGVGIA